jgi:hypothetical protein
VAQFPVGVKDISHFNIQISSGPIEPPTQCVMGGCFLRCKTGVE